MDYRILNLGKYYNAKIKWTVCGKVANLQEASYHTTEKFVLYDEELCETGVKFWMLKDIDGVYYNLPLPPGYVLVKGIIWVRMYIFFDVKEISHCGSGEDYFFSHLQEYPISLMLLNCPSVLAEIPD